MPFDPAREQWSSYMTHFECLMEAKDLLGLSDNQKRALFLSHCRHDVFNMAESLSEPTLVQSVLWQVLQNMLRTHYAPVLSKMVRCHEFCQWNQKDGELINQYITALQKAATHCEFRDLDNILLDQLICGMRDIRFQCRLLAKANLIL